MRNLLFISAFMLASGIAWGCSQTGSSNGSQQQTEAHNEAPEMNQEQVAEETVSQGDRLVQISTEFGDIVIMLYDETPLHRDNFLKLASQGFYDGTLFHRVIQGFMIQGGDPESRDAGPEQRIGSGGPGYNVPAEIIPGLFHKKGAVAAARQGDQVNPERNSSGSQFYIVQGRVYTSQELDMMEQQTGKAFTPEQRQAYTTVGGTPHLDDAYSVFGEVLQGLDVVEKIAATPKGPGDRPQQNIPMTVELLD